MFKILLIIPLLFSVSLSFSQENNEMECERLLALTSPTSSYVGCDGFVELIIKAETVCNDIGKDNYDRLLYCIQQLMDTYETDSKEYNQYLDTLMVYWDKSEKIGHYNQSDDVIRGYYYTLQNPADYVKADFYFTRGIKNQGMKLDDEVYIVLYYYNIYTLWYMEQDEAKKAELKQRYIKEYFDMSKLIKDANYSPKTQETLTQYLAQVITFCNDLTPEVPAFISNLPEETESKKSALFDMATLFEDKGCTEEKAYKMIVDTLFKLGPTNPMFSQFGCPQPDSSKNIIDQYGKLAGATISIEDKNRYQYLIASEYLKLGNYRTAYAKAASIAGEYKSKALVIQAKAVAASVNDCGESTFDRKCNYLHVIELLEQAGGQESAIAAYREIAPDRSSPCSSLRPVVLPCWGVTVHVCE